MRNAHDTLGRCLIFLALLALTHYGCGGGSDPTGPDADAVTVTLTAPAEGDTVSGAVTISATAQHADSVRIFIDGGEIGADTSAPYEITWNTGTVSNGVRAVKARAEGSGGAAEDQVAVVVDNQTGSVIVTVSPVATTVELGLTQQFIATVTGSQNTAVTWCVDEGSQWGAVTTGGLYTAPLVLPSPAAATVRATSVADPTKSAAAAVTIVEGQGGPTTEEELCQQTFAAAYEAGDLGTEAVGIAAEAVWGATELNNDIPTFTGTLTQTGPDSDVWTYSTTPTDKLVLVYYGGPTVELKFTTFEGYTEGTWEDFLLSHTLDFTVFRAGAVDARIQSEAGLVSGCQRRVYREAPHGYEMEWNRKIVGTVVFEGETVALDLTHTGTENGTVDWNWADYEYQEQYAGTVASPTSTTTVSESSWGSLIHDGANARTIINKQLWNNSSATLGSSTYQYQNAHVAWASQGVLGETLGFVVIDEEYWVAQGAMLKDGALFGQVQFDAPVIEGTGGPDLILHLTTGEDVLLHTLID